MAARSDALLRYRTIDACLRDTTRKYTLKDLIGKCSEALGRKVSTRTVQLDIQFMRDKKEGYGAPITVFENRYYRYRNQNYSLTDTLVKKRDIASLQDIVTTLKQYSAFREFGNLKSAVNIIDEEMYEGSTSFKAIELSAELLLLIIQRAIRPAGNTESRMHHSQLAALWSEVAKDLKAPWHVEELARMMNCSRSQFTRICNAIYHKSPGQKIREMKMENAKILLSGSSVPVREVAEAVGFSSLSLFSSSFASYTGMGPREFRKMKMVEESGAEKQLERKT